MRALGLLHLTSLSFKLRKVCAVRYLFQFILYIICIQIKNCPHRTLSSFNSLENEYGYLIWPQLNFQWSTCKEAVLPPTGTPISKTPWSKDGIRLGPDSKAWHDLTRKKDARTRTWGRYDTRLGLKHGTTGHEKTRGKTFRIKKHES